MSPKHVFWGLVIVVTALFSLIYAALGNYPLAALAFGLGVMWLTADATIENDLGTFFFLAFAALAVIANFSDTLIPLTLLGMSANLAAWDMSRFRARIADENGQDGRAILEMRHLRLLVVIISFGFLIALLPLVFRLAIPFIIVCGVALLTLLALQQSMHSLRTDHD